MQTRPLSHTVQDNARQELGAQLCAPTGGVHGQIGQIHISWRGRLRLHEGESQEIPLFIKDTQTPSSGPIPPIVGQIGTRHPPLIKGLFKDVLDRLVVIYAELLDMWCHSGVLAVEAAPSSIFTVAIPRPTVLLSQQGATLVQRPLAHIRPRAACFPRPPPSL
jgi:hypothetical protein